MTMRKVFLIISMLCLGMMAGAQRFAPYRQYVTFNAGIGLNGYGYSLADEGSKDINGGMMLRLGYHYVKRDCGFWAGLMLQSFNHNTVISHTQEIPKAVNQDGAYFTHLTRFNDLEENNRQLLFSIPVEFNYRIYMGEGMKLILGVGPVVNFSMRNRFRVTSGSLKTMMLYPEYGDMLVDDEAHQHHLYTTSGFNGKYKLKTAPGMIFDATILYPLEKNFELNVGFYGTVMSSQLGKRQEYVYNPDCMQSDAYTNPVYNGVFDSKAVDKLSPFSMGVTVGLYYYISFKDKKSSSGGSGSN